MTYDAVLISVDPRYCRWARWPAGTALLSLPLEAPLPWMR